MSKKVDLKVSMVESYPLKLGSDLGLEGKSLTFASEVLEREGLELLYESHTKVLNPLERSLFEKFQKNVPENLQIFLDPLVTSFAVRDACDCSEVDYVWLDLEGQDNVGNCVWIRKGNGDKIMALATEFLERHFEKYLIDAYDRRTREDMARVWEAQLKLSECWICGSTQPLERRLIVVKGQKIRGWTCTNCDHHTILPEDTLTYLKKKRSKSG